MSRLIVGLGNPGKQYDGTRHNIGFHFVDILAQKYDFPSFKEAFKGLLSEKNLDGTKVFLFKPSTYMNLSGEAVLEILNFYKIPFKNVLVIYDDVDLPLGEFRYREKGSAGTHNGMRSVLGLLGAEEVPRLRIGIDLKDRALWKGSLSDFVLGHFSKEEKALLNEKITCHLENFFLKYPSL